MTPAALATKDPCSDDIIRDILVRLEDAADLFRCAVTCKRWRRLIVKASFLRRCLWADHASMFFSGFFVWEEVVRKKGNAFVTTLIPTWRSVFGSKHRTLKSFFSGVARSQLHNAVPLASRHGLLLVRLDPPDSPDVTVHLAVCNMLVGTCHRLPPLQCDWKFDNSGYAILTDTDCSSNTKQHPLAPKGCSEFFKVLIIGSDRYHQPRNLHSFTSGKQRWNNPNKFAFSAKGKRGYTPLRNLHAIVWCGMAHWLVRILTCNEWHWHTIDVDAQTCRISLTKIETPIGHGKIHYCDEALLTVDADGKLSLFHMQKRGYQLEVWTRQEDGGPSRWLCAPDIELNPPRRMSLLILGEKGGMLIVKNNHGDVYTVDLETGDMKKVMSFDAINRRQIVPFDMDWPTFFVSRLRGPVDEGKHESKKLSS